MGIKIIREGNLMVAKGNPAATNAAYFFAILLLIVGSLMIISGNLGAAILAIIATILIYAGAHQSKKARLKKLNEAQLSYPPSITSSYTPSPIKQNEPASIKCSNCGNMTGTLNSFCPKCGANIKIDSSIKCSNCGKLTDSINSFCPHCGSKLIKQQKNIENIADTQRYQSLAGSQPNNDKKGYGEDASNLLYGASYVAGVQNNTDDDTADDDDDYEDEH